jgi:fatty acid desaturase
MTCVMMDRSLTALEKASVRNCRPWPLVFHVTPTWWERLIFCPGNVNYHLAHHLFPSVPFFNLPRLHRRLMQEEVFRERAHITVGYTSMLCGVLAEVTAGRRKTLAAAVGGDVGSTLPDSSGNL